MNFCPKCGKPINDEFDFCMSCGVKINEDAMVSKSMKQPLRKNAKKILLIAIAVVLVALVGTIVYGSLAKKNDRTAFEQSYLFSEYAHITPTTVSDADDFAEEGIMRETFSSDVEWTTVEEYCKALENLGFIMEDLSSDTAASTTIKTFLRFTKTISADANGAQCDRVFVIQYRPNAPFSDAIEIQIELDTYVKNP